MVKRLNEAFRNEDHKAMKEAKDIMAGELGLKKLSWEKYLLHISGIKIIQKEE